MNPGSKTKLTLSINPEALEKAKRKAKQKGIPLSRAVENFLEFFSDPKVYCFKCGEEIDSQKSQQCPKCTWLICSSCNSCGCDLDGETATAVFHMRRVYEDLLSGKVK